MEKLPVKADPTAKIPVIPQETVKEVLFLIANTTTPLKEIAESFGVDEMYLFQILHNSPEQISHYARAVEQRCHLEIMQQAELEKECINEIKTGTIDPKLGNALVQAYRLKSDNAKWRACKLYPRIYGERIEHNVVGISKESDDAYRQRIAKLTIGAGAGAGTSVDEAPAASASASAEREPPPASAKAAPTAGASASEEKPESPQVTEANDQKNTAESKEISNDLPDLF